MWTNGFDVATEWKARPGCHKGHMKKSGLTIIIIITLSEILH